MHLGIKYTSGVVKRTLSKNTQLKISFQEIQLENEPFQIHFPLFKFTLLKNSVLTNSFKQYETFKGTFTVIW